MNSALSDQRSPTALWDCTTHGSSCTEVEDDPQIIQLYHFRQPPEKRNETMCPWTILFRPVISNLFSRMTLYSQAMPPTDYLEVFDLSYEKLLLWVTKETLQKVIFQLQALGFGVPPQKIQWPHLATPMKNFSFLQKHLQSVFLLFIDFVIKLLLSALLATTVLNWNYITSRRNV